MSHAAEVDKNLRDIRILTTQWNYVSHPIHDVTERVNLGLHPRDAQSKRPRFLTQRLECLRKNFGCHNRILREVNISGQFSNVTLQLTFPTFFRVLQRHGTCKCCVVYMQVCRG